MLLNRISCATWLMRLLLVVVAGTLASAALAGPTKIELGGIGGFDWSPPISLNVLRFTGTGSGDGAAEDFAGTGGLIYQDKTLPPYPPWNDDGLWATDLTSFDFGIWNKSSGSIEGLILLVAYQGSGADFSLTLSSGGSESFADEDFETLADYGVFGGGGARPGDGEAALYTSADGVIFIDLGAGLGPDSDGWWGDSPSNADSDDTLMNINVSVTGSSLPEALHFDAYAFDGTNDVFGTNSASKDLTATDPPSSSVPEASTAMLFGSGLLGLLGFARHKARSLIGR